MGKLISFAGSHLYIGQAKAFTGTDLVQADFSSQVWTEIKGLTDGGALGDVAQLITSSQVGASRDRKAKGTRNAGSMQIVCDFDGADAGQLALIAAERTPDSYAFRLVLNDAPSGGTPSERMFVAFVLSANEQFGNANSVVQVQSTLEVDSNVVRIAAAS